MAEPALPTKIIVRHLPPTLSKKDFLSQLGEITSFSCLNYIKPKYPLSSQHIYNTAYFKFDKTKDIYLFRDKLDGYVFLDDKGNEYRAIVELAPYQKIAKPSKEDRRKGSIYYDGDYERFLNDIDNEAETSVLSVEAMLSDIESKKNASGDLSTPLVEFIKDRRQLRKREQEARRKKDLEKKSQIGAQDSVSDHKTKGAVTLTFHNRSRGTRSKKSKSGYSSSRSFFSSRRSRNTFFK